MRGSKANSDTLQSQGPFGWIRDLGPKERSTFGACVGGWALDAMDFQMYPLVISTLSVMWQLSNANAGQLATAALLTSAIGGWLAGFVADRIGRVRTLQLAILWFAFFTFLSGLTQNYWQLFATRALLGLGFGGEWAAGAVLLGEAVRPEHRGKALGMMQSGWAVGWAAALALYNLFFWLLPPEQAWRAVFMIGLAPALMVFFVRRFVEEPPVYLENKAKLKATGDKPSFFEIFEGRLLRITLLGALMGTGAQGGYAAVMTFLPKFLREVRHLSVLGSSKYLIVLIIGAFLGYVSGGILADKIGRRMTFLVYAIGAAIIAATYTSISFGDNVMLVLGFPLGFFSAGVFSGMGAFYTEHFPTRVRGVGQGFTYNVGRGVSAIFPALVGYLGDRIGLGYAIGIFAVIGYATMAAAAYLLPETKGKALTA